MISKFWIEDTNHPIRWSSLLILAIVLTVGFYLRFVSLKETQVIQPLRADAKDYFLYAYNLRHEHIYSKDVRSIAGPESIVSPDAVRSPGYLSLIHI